MKPHRWRVVIHLCLMLTILGPMLWPPIEVFALPLTAPGKCQGTSFDIVNNSNATLRMENTVVSGVSLFGCSVRGNLRVQFRGENRVVSNVQGSVDANNNFTADSLPYFELRVAGLTLKVSSAAITAENSGRLELKSMRIRVPDAWGGFESGRFNNRTYIDQGGLLLGRFELPAIKTQKGFELTLSGALRIVTGGYEVDADGSLAFPDTSRIPGCNIAAGVTLYFDGLGYASMDINASSTYPAEALQARRSVVALPAGQTALTAAAMPVSSHFLPVPPMAFNPFAASANDQTLHQATGAAPAEALAEPASLPTYLPARDATALSASQPYRWALWEDGSYDRPLAYADDTGVVGLPEAPAPTTAAQPALVGPLPNTTEAVDGLALREVRVSMSCDKGIPIGQSGFQLTGVNGTLSLRPDNQFVNIGVVIETVAKVGGTSLLKATANAQFQWKPEYDLTIQGALFIFGTYQIGSASVGINQNRGFSGNVWVRGVLWEAAISIRAWNGGGRFHFTGSAEVRFGMGKGQIFDQCASLPCGVKICKKWGIPYPCGVKFCNVCVSIPPSDLWLGGVRADFGAFTNGAYGIKGTVSFMGYSIGAYVDTAGRVRFGDVSGYRLISSPTVRAARTEWNDLRTLGVNQPQIIRDAVSYAFPDDGRVVLGVNTPFAEADYGLTPANVITGLSIITQTDTLFSVKSNLPLSVSLLSPEGVTITVDNYATEPGGYVISYTEVTSYTLKRAVPGEGSEPDRLANEVRLRLIPSLFEPTLPVQAVDVQLNGQVVLSNASLTLPTTIDYFPIVSGTYEVALTAVGDPQPLITHTFTAISGNTYTLLPTGSLAGGAPLQAAPTASTERAPSGGTCYATPDDGTTVFSGPTAQAVRDAVAAASAGGTVKIAGTCAGVAPSDGTTQTVRLNQALTLSGGYTPTDWMNADPQANPTVLDAEQAGRVIYANAPLTLTGLTLQNGLVDDHGAGAYFNYVPGVVLYSRFISNTTTSFGYGGGAAFFDTATIGHSVFQGNTGDSFGGGAYVRLNAIIYGTTFDNNQAQLDGGGLYRGTDGMSDIHDSSFVNNRAVNQGGGGISLNSPATVTVSFFGNNQSGGSGGGGAFFSSANLAAVTFTNNRANFGSGGGALFGGVTQLGNATFTNNRSQNYGGGAFFNLNSIGTVASSQFVGNTSNRGGAASVDSTGLSQWTNVLLAGNTATVEGAGLIVDAGGTLNLVHATVTSPTLASQQAILVNNGTVNLTNTIISQHAVGLARTGGTLTAQNTLFFANTADTSGSVTNNAPVFGNPNFVDTINYRLGMGSAAMDAGAVPVPDVPFDFESNPRPFAAGYDIGHDELAFEINWIVVPPAVAFTTTAEFGFASNVPGAEFYCSLNYTDPELCTSPAVYTNLPSGPNAFEVFALINGDEQSNTLTWNWDVYPYVNAASLTSLEEFNAAPLDFGTGIVRVVNADATTLPDGGITVSVGGVEFGPLALTQGQAYHLPVGSLPVAITDSHGSAFPADEIQLAEGMVKTLFVSNGGQFIETLDEEYAVFTTKQFVVDQATRGFWQVFVDGDTENADFAVAVAEAPNPPIVTGLVVDASNLANTVVSYTLLSENPPVFIRIYANNGPLTETLVMTETQGTITSTYTVTVPLFVGEEVATISATTVITNEPLAQTFDLSRLESGNYSLWVKVEDSNNAPVQGYVVDVANLRPGEKPNNDIRVASERYNALEQLANAALIGVDNTATFSTTWSSTISTAVNPRFVQYDISGTVVFDEVFNGLFIEFTPYAHPDVDSYVVRLVNQLGQTEIITAGVTTYERFDAQGNPLGSDPVAFSVFNGVRPGSTYTITIGAEDFETGRITWSTSTVASVPPGDFEVTAQTPVVEIDGDGVTGVVTATLLLTLSAELYSGVRFHLQSGNQLPTSIVLSDIVFSPYTPTAMLTPLQRGLSLPTPRDMRVSNADITLRAEVPLELNNVAAGNYLLPIVAFSGEVERHVAVTLRVNAPPVSAPPTGGTFTCDLPQATSATALTVTVPNGAFASAFDLYCQQGASNLSDTNLRFAGLVFEVRTTQGGTPVGPSQPLTIQVTYGNDWYGGLRAESMVLQQQTGPSWSAVTCTNNTTTRTLACPTSTTGTFALFAMYDLFLPMLRR